MNGRVDVPWPLFVVIGLLALALAVTLLVYVIAPLAVIWFVVRLVKLWRQRRVQRP